MRWRGNSWLVLELPTTRKFRSAAGVDGNVLLGGAFDDIGEKFIFLLSVRRRIRQNNPETVRLDFAALHVHKLKDVVHG